MEYSFTCHGHKNIIAKHKTTFEFTKDEEIGLEGDCIVGVRADFQLNKIKEFIKSLGNNNKITITIETLDYNDKDYNNKNSDKIKNYTAENKIIEKINAEINPGFDSDKEMVIRKSDFMDKRTFAIKADKAAFELINGLVEFLQQPSNEIRIYLA